MLCGLGQHSKYSNLLWVDGLGLNPGVGTSFSALGKVRLVQDLFPVGKSVRAGPFGGWGSMVCMATTP